MSWDWTGEQSMVIVDHFCLFVWHRTTWGRITGPGKNQRPQLIPREVGSGPYIGMHYIVMHYIGMHYIGIHYIGMHYIGVHCIGMGECENG